MADGTRRRLLRAGRITFTRDGFAGASITSILEAAEVSPPALYHHFGSKSGLFAAVVTEVYAAFVRRLEDSAVGCDDFVTAVDAVLAEASRIHRNDPTLAPLAVVAQFEYRRDPEAHALLAEPMSAFTALARQLAVLAQPIDHDVVGSELALIALLNGISSLAPNTPPDEFDRLIAALRRLIGAWARGS